MHVLIATDSFAPKIDGVADTSAIVSRELQRRGHAVTVVAPGPGPEAFHGCAVVRLPSVQFPLYPELRIAARFSRVGRLIKARPPDAAIVLTAGPTGVMTARALPPDVPLLHIYTTDMPAYVRTYGFGLLCSPVERIVRWLSDRAIATLCPTAHVRDDLAARGHPRLEVWGRGVDAELFHPARRSNEMRMRLSGGEPERPLVLYVGRMAREKRLIDIVDAAPYLPDARFAFVGDGPDRDRLERLLADRPAVFTGYLRGPALAEAFASADVFVFPSDSDTFGQVVLQSMASGVPPIVVEGSAPTNFVERGIEGLHVAPRSGGALAVAIAELTNDPARRARMGEAARRRALRHSWPALVGRLEWMLAGRPALAMAAR